MAEHHKHVLLPLQRLPAADKPKDIMGDDDSGFKGVFAQTLALMNPPISLRKTTAKEGKSVIDAAMYHFKIALNEDMQQRNTTGWIGQLDRVVAGQNNKGHYGLAKATPNEVGTGINTWLQYSLLVKNTKHMEQNSKAWERSKKGLECLQSSAELW